MIGKWSFALDGRREAIYVALAAAEVCWVAPLFLALGEAAFPHPPLLLWLGLLVLLLGFFYFYRALAEANLSLRFQQSLLVVTLLLSMGLFLRFHIYAGTGWRGTDWLLQPLRHLTNLMTVTPTGWIAIMFLIYFWARGIHLARRSISADSVGFSFRAGVVILVLDALAINIFTGGDMAGFIAPFFFFALVAVALARIEEVRLLPNSSRVGFSGFWIGSTVAAVALLALLGMVVAAFFYGSGLAQILDWLSPILYILWVIVIGLAVLVALLIEGLFALLSIDVSIIGMRLREAMQRLSEILVLLPLPAPLSSEGQTGPTILAVLQVVITIAIPAAIIALVVLYTWYRTRRSRREERDESRESLLSAAAVARSLQAMLQSGRDRLSELMDLVDRFGLGSRFLSAISIRRIYANVARLATEAGYPRSGAQTPYEYLETLYEALPGSESDVALITEAYVNAHYGQVPDNREELQRIRDCWERVRSREANK